MIKLNKLIALLCCVLALVRAGHLSSADLNFQTDQKQTELNESDQNQTDNQIDAKELLKSFLLKKLDLDAIPTNLTDTKVPKFLLDIFETNTLFKKNRIYLPHDSNTVRSHPLIGENRAQKAKLNKSGFLLKFNLSLPSREKLNAGELRLYLNRSNRCPSRKQRIFINQIIQISNGQRAENDYTTVHEENGLVYRQIDTLVIKYDRHMDKPNWIQFDVLPAVETWSKNSSLNYGLLVKSFCVTRDEFTLNEDKFVDNFVIQPAVNEDSKDEMYENFKPVLLTYSNFHTTDYSADNFVYFMNKRKRHINPHSVISSIRNNYQESIDWKKGKTKDCAKYPMYVDFKEIGWQDWIVSPVGYNAYLCYGQCSLSFVRNSNTTTNHATTQSLSNGIHPDIVPPPCCVPTEFSPMAMIYRDGSASVLKIYDQMIVTSCGCR